MFCLTKRCFQATLVHFGKYCVKFNLRKVSGSRVIFETLFVRCYSSKPALSSYTFRSHTCGELRPCHVGERVTLCGWTKKKRAIGELDVTFIPLVDYSGTTQLTCSSHILKDALSAVKTETVVMATGMVAARPEKDINCDVPTGAIEVQVESLKVLNDIPSPLPFSPSSKAPPVANIELRLRERHLDLRRDELQRNLRLRSQVAMKIREFLIQEHGFVEIETPTLFRQTSEGAREFIVPTRTRKEFYSLVQSPQQYKQLLMVGGFDRYFQFARCYRDEDLRADRQPEFTQVDLEMSFVDTNGVIHLTEDLITTTLTDTIPHFNFTQKPFPQMTYTQAMQKYSSDKPDTRENQSDSKLLNFLWVTDFPLFTLNEENGSLESTHHPFTAPVPMDEHLLYTGDIQQLLKIRGLHYDLVVNGVELGGGSIRVHNPAIQEHILKNILQVPVDQFVHLLKGLRSGCPPHGGIALGFDRLMAILCEANSLRDVIAFPKSFKGKELLTGAPCKLDNKVLQGYHISLLQDKSS